VPLSVYLLVPVSQGMPVLPFSINIILHVSAHSSSASSMCGDLLYKNLTVCEIPACKSRLDGAKRLQKHTMRRAAISILVSVHRRMFQSWERSLAVGLDMVNLYSEVALD
jgi:hypothetical protein